MPDPQPTPIGAAMAAPGVDACRERASPDHHRNGRVDRQVDPIDAPRRPPWGKRQVLLLNATFEPLTALPLRRAVVLVVCGKAEVVHEDPAGTLLHSVRTAIEVPSVIRLHTFVKVPYRSRVPLTRAGIMYRDGYRCAYCESRAETIDHVIPRSRGGNHTWTNCVACCARCNHRKAARLLTEIGWQLPVKPVAPRGPHWRLLMGHAEPDPLWLPYLDQPAA